MAATFKAMLPCTRSGCKAFGLSKPAQQDTGSGPNTDLCAGVGDLWRPVPLMKLASDLTGKEVQGLLLLSLC